MWTTPFMMPPVLYENTWLKSKYLSNDRFTYISSAVSKSVFYQHPAYECVEVWWTDIGSQKQQKMWKWNSNTSNLKSIITLRFHWDGIFKTNGRYSDGCRSEFKKFSPSSCAQHAVPYLLTWSKTERGSNVNWVKVQSVSSLVSTVSIAST